MLACRDGADVDGEVGGENKLASTNLNELRVELRNAINLERAQNRKIRHSEELRVSLCSSE